MRNLQKTLHYFKENKNFCDKSALCLALVVTQHARKNGLPLDPETLLTESRGQVRGMGRAAVQAVLKRHGIERVLAAEGGRTSQGSVGRMREYVSLLNSLAAKAVDIDAVEAFWVECARDFFASNPQDTAKPLKIRFDASLGLRALVRGVLEQAQKRQQENPGMQYAGAAMQHLVGAKLDCALDKGHFEHHSFSTSDAQTGRAGDFFVGDVAIHVTTAPGEAVIGRCRSNIDAGAKPVIVTTGKGLHVAEALAENAGLGGRIDIFEIEQFIALNLYELGRFEQAGRRTAVQDVVKRYNEIVDEVETDPSLKIELRA